jgi:hypothetical protein
MFPVNLKKTNNNFNPIFQGGDSENTIKIEYFVLDSGANEYDYLNEITVKLNLYNIFT